MGQLAYWQATGSSPREWGKRLLYEYEPDFARVIPTRVGKASIQKSSPSQITGHPHASGESSSFSLRCAARNGSSPREWGKLEAAVATLRNFRVIPTRVGKALARE